VGESARRECPEQGGGREGKNARERTVRCEAARLWRVAKKGINRQTLPFSNFPKKEKGKIRKRKKKTFLFRMGRDVKICWKIAGPVHGARDMSNNPRTDGRKEFGRGRKGKWVKLAYEEGGKICIQLARKKSRSCGKRQCNPETTRSRERD